MESEKIKERQAWKYRWNLSKGLGVETGKRSGGWQAIIAPALRPSPSSGQIT